MKNIFFMALIMLIGASYGETSQDVLSLLGNPNAEIRKSLVGNISDNDVLKMVALGDPDAKVRAVAIRRITDQKLIADILYESPSAELIDAVFGCVLGIDNGYNEDALSDQDVLKNLARRCTHSGKSEGMRALFGGVARSITDEIFLMNLFRQVNDNAFREVILRNRCIKDVTFLENIILDDSMPESIKNYAFTRLPDEELLSIVSSTSLWTQKDRKNALRELVGVSVFSRRNTQHKNIDAIINLVMTVEDEEEKAELITSLCLRVSNHQAALAAVLKKIDDKITSTINRHSIKAFYIAYIDDVELIDEILDNSTSEAVFVRAEEHVQMLMIREQTFKMHLFDGL